MAVEEDWETPAFQESRKEALARTNPLFGSRRLKLGTFCTNVSGAATMSTMDGVYELSWPNISTVAGLADAMAFEAIVPIARIGDSREDAQRQLDHCIHEKGDLEAADNMLGEMGVTTQGKVAEAREGRKVHVMAGYNGLQLLGTPGEIVDDLRSLADAGVDGTLLSWPSYVAGMRRFQE